jgi:hypothetical protein
VNDPQTDPDLGPLPKSDEKADLQRRSLKALNALLEDQDSIVFRDERTEDYGVDGSFELKLGNLMTNFRAQVQMKGTASIEANQDGSMSLSVKTANLNYLLNGPSPIYILFDMRNREFWYVWAQDEQRRLHAENQEWRKQEEITLRFRERFTTGALGSIVARVQAEGRLHRRIHDSLARATTSEPIVIKIDTSSLNVTDPSQARDILIASGMAIVAAGYPNETLQLFHLLGSTIRDLPRIQLTAAYAEYMLGKHYNALGHIRQAISRGQDLSERDRSFLSTLKDACEFRVGLIDTAAYCERMERRGQALAGLESLEAQQEALYQQFLSMGDAETRFDVARRVRETTERILSHQDATDAAKLAARLILLYVEGADASLIATREAILAQHRMKMFPDRSDATAQNLQKAKSRLAEWEASAQRALKDAYNIRHPILIGEALTVVLKICLGDLLDRRLDSIARSQTFDVPEATKRQLEQYIRDASEIIRANGTLEGRLRLSNLQADFLEITGNLAAAKALASRVYPEAEAMGFAKIAERANELIEDRTITMQFERQVAQWNTTDQDVLFAEYDDAGLKRFAREVLDTVGSPPADAAVVEEYCRSLHEIAKERLYWCRHLDILENLGQTTHSSTPFNVLPDRRCSCRKFGYKTDIVTADAHALIATFKKIYCATCTNRDPKL